MLEDNGRYIHRIWRVLDADTSFLGIKGRFLLLFCVVSASGIVLSLLAVPVVGSLIAAVLVFTSIGAGYVVTQVVQAKMSVRQFRRLLSGRNISRYSKVKPQSISDHIKENTI